MSCWLQQRSTLNDEQVEERIFTLFFYLLFAPIPNRKLKMTF
jgi:hypothetical protein